MGEGSIRIVPDRHAARQCNPAGTLGGGSGGGGGGGRGASTIWSIQGSVSWDLDVWGKVRRQIESNVAGAQVSAAGSGEREIVGAGDAGDRLF